MEYYRNPETVWGITNSPGSSALKPCEICTATTTAACCCQTYPSITRSQFAVLYPKRTSSGFPTPKNSILYRRALLSCVWVQHGERDHSIQTYTWSPFGVVAECLKQSHPTRINIHWNCHTLPQRTCLNSRGMLVRVRNISTRWRTTNFGESWPAPSPCIQY